MSDQELADAVIKAVHELNKALELAEIAGLSTNVEVDPFPMDEGKCSTTVSVKISRLVITDYSPKPTE